MSQIVNEILHQNLLTIRTPPATRTSHEADGIQWIRMEELGKVLTNRCRAVRKLKGKRRKTQGGTRDRHTNSEELEFECKLKTPTRSRIHELLNLGASSSHKLLQSLITHQDLLRLREDMWPNHKTQRKGWWCRAFATAINRQFPTCNRLWTTTQFPPSLPQCLACSQKGAEKKPSQFKILKNEAGLIFQPALPEDLEWDTRIEDVALSLDATKRCLTNMLVALDRDTPQMKGGLTFPLTCTAQDLMMTQEPPWLWFTLPELGFPMLTDEYRRPVHPEIEEYLPRCVTNDQDWGKVDDEDCWGVNYTEPTTEIKEKIESILLTWGGEHP